MINLHFSTESLLNDACFERIKQLVLLAQNTTTAPRSVGGGEATTKGPFEILHNEKIGQLKRTAEEMSSGKSREEIAEERLKSGGYLENERSEDESKDIFV